MNEIVDIYCRVSTTNQFEEGYSIQEQEERLRKYADAHGWIIKDVLIDGGFSGKDIDRPAIKILIEDAENNRIDKALVYKLDRLSRSQRDTMYLIEDVFLKNKVDFVSMTENLDTSTPLGMAMIGIMSVFAQLEREQIKERMAMGRNARAKTGKYRGGGNPPYGYMRDKTCDCLKPDPAAAFAVKTCFEMYKNGESMKGIARWLNENTTSTTGHLWIGAHVKRVLENPVYIGKYLWQGKEYDAIEGHVNLIDVETFEIVQKEMKRRLPKSGDEKPQTPFKHKEMLGGLLWCGKCGGRYMGYHQRDVTRFYCYNRMSEGKFKGRSCDNVSWRTDRLDAVIIEEIKKLNVDRSLLEQTNARTEKVLQDIASLEKRIADLDKQQERIIDLFSVGTIDMNFVSRKSAQISKERETIKNKIETLRTINMSAITDAINQLNTFDQLIKTASTENEELRNIVRQLIQSITIHENGLEIKWRFQSV